MLKTVFTAKSPAGVAYYSPILLGPSTIAQASSRASTVRKVREILARLEPDDYTRYIDQYYASGLERFGDDWCYADICTVLQASASLLAPKSYLEIGVRRGRSMAMVVAVSPGVEAVGFDMWMENYAGMENPGADFVQAEMKRLSHTGSLELISGNSHETVPAYFERNPGKTFDIITVDGDHSEQGALDDLRTVIPRLSEGGVLVFDDIAHPQHPYLLDVWNQAIEEDGNLQSHEFLELGYGVAVALRVGPPRAAGSAQGRLWQRSRGGLKQLKNSLQGLRRRIG